MNLVLVRKCGNWPRVGPCGPCGPRGPPGSLDLSVPIVLASFLLYIKRNSVLHNYDGYFDLLPVLPLLPFVPTTGNRTTLLNCSPNHIGKGTYCLTLFVRGSYFSCIGVKNWEVLVYHSSNQTRSKVP